MAFGIVLGFAGGVFFALAWSLIEWARRTRDQDRWNVEVDQSLKLAESPRYAVRRSTDDRGAAAVIGGAAILLVALVVAGIYITARLSSEKTITCTVTEKDRTTKITSDSHGGSSSSSDARIYTEDCGTLQVADEVLKGVWTSADTYAAIKPGQRYEFRVIGWRNGFFSAFPNIIEANEVGR